MSVSPPVAIALLAVLALATSALGAGDAGAPPAEAPAAAAPEAAGPAAESRPPIRLTGALESGFLAVLSHAVQFGSDGTVFSYRREGGQDVLFHVYRATVELEIEPCHRIALLYQPLSLRTEVSLERTVRVDGLDFPAGTVVDLDYDFPFYRLSYLYDAAPAGVEELAFGLSLQIRNATISFRSADGTLFRRNRDVGPVPLLKLRGRYGFGAHVWGAFEIDWIYAPVSYLNGSDSDVTGALLDASLRAGVTLDRIEAFFNVRILSGGASGTSEPDGPGDGFVSNWLDFLTVTLGVTVSV